MHMIFALCSVLSLWLCVVTYLLAACCCISYLRMCVCVCVTSLTSMRCVESAQHIKFFFAKQSQSATETLEKKHTSLRHCKRIASHIPIITIYRHYQYLPIGWNARNAIQLTVCVNVYFHFGRVNCSRTKCIAGLLWIFVFGDSQTLHAKFRIHLFIESRCIQPASIFIN